MIYIKRFIYVIVMTLVYPTLAVLMIIYSILFHLPAQFIYYIVKGDTYSLDTVTDWIDYSILYKLSEKLHSKLNFD